MYLPYVVGHGCEGGLAHFLKGKLWATDLISTFLMNSLFCLFVIDIELTNLGFIHLEEVSSFSILYCQEVVVISQLIARIKYYFT